MVSVVKFEIFNKVAEKNSFTKAAEALNLTQSAVSHAINSLENEFDFPLVNRNRRFISITNEGEILLQSIRKILFYYDMVYQEASSIKGLTKGTIKIGVFKSVTSFLLPEIIKQMQVKYPYIHIELKEGNYQEIEKWLLNGIIDCGFLNVDHSNFFDVIPLKKDRLLCVVSKGSKLYDHSIVYFRDLEDEPFIMPAYGGDHDVKRMLKENQVKPKILFELMDEDAIMSLVSHQLGVTILPELVLQNIPSQLRAIPLEEYNYRRISLAIRHNISPAVKLFVEMIKLTLEKLSNN